MNTIPLIFTGVIDITDNIKFVMDIIASNNPNIVIINLDEYNDNIRDGMIPNQVIQGGELLPPPEAIIAENDGNMQEFDYIYSSWYSQPSMQLFVAGIMVSLYTGKNILLYTPDLNNQESISIPKMLNLFWDLFGIKIGIVGSQTCFYNVVKTPIWLSLMYRHRVIPAYDFMIHFPTGCPVDPRDMRLLEMDVRPFGNNPEKSILDFMAKLKINPKTRPVLKDISGRFDYNANGWGC